MKGNFQNIFLAIFIAGGILGVLVFSGTIPIGKKNSLGGQGTVVLWGTINQQLILPAVDDFNRVNTDFVLKYVQKDPVTFDQDLLEALASGNGPDLFFLPDNLIHHYQNRILTIPYTSLPIATFKTSFVGASDVFLSSKGITALPLYVDPMVMYYNRSILDANNIVNPPATWDELQNLIPVLTKKDQNNKIIKSAVALGQFSNISHAKDIISTLFMQAGNSIVAEQNGLYYSSLASGPVSLDSFLKFYTDFANPLNTSYSWNKSLPVSINSFSSEDVAFYFGYSSELPVLVNKNPNQNFLVAPMPQFKNSKTKVTFGHVTGVAISSASKNSTAAFTVAGILTNGTFFSKIFGQLSVVPARRDLLTVKPTDAYFPIFYSSALFAKSWSDPSTLDTDIIFQGMIDNILSGNMVISNALSDASMKLSLLLAK
ncbi:extracellular solute-binding protein [Candidatus Nomurabacteria bacterium]|nr:extracellular solute-binding protein [Candidatus Nomurabacteria bacterium]